jgi:small-conductance mechanosensitive channel
LVFIPAQAAATGAPETALRTCAAIIHDACLEPRLPRRRLHHAHAVHIYSARLFGRGVIRMIRWLILAMVYLGSLLMVYNIYGFVRFARYVKKLDSWKTNNTILYLPIVLLVCFLLGYLAVGIFGKPDLIVAGILFGGSVFVFVMYKLLSGITQRIVESERLEAERRRELEEQRRREQEMQLELSEDLGRPKDIIDWSEEPEDKFGYEEYKRATDFVTKFNVTNDETLKNLASKVAKK